MLLLSEFRVMGTRQWNSGLYTDEEFNENWSSISFLQRTMLFYLSI